MAFYKVGKWKFLLPLSRRISVFLAKFDMVEVTDLKGNLLYHQFSF